MTPSGKYRFKRHDNIGSNDALDDNFLQTCFQDTGDLAVLADCKNPQRIVLGRTGTGKTALLMELERRTSNVIRINPENLSLNYIANSAVLHELSSLGINIEPFFKLLWRHVFTISIIQRVFHDSKANDKQGFIQRLRLLFESPDSAKTRKRKSENNSKA